MHIYFLCGHRIPREYACRWAVIPHPNPSGLCLKPLGLE